MHRQIPGCRHRRKVRKRRRVRVVAVHTVVAHAGSAAKIPVPVHAAVGSAVVIAKLRSVALRAELHGLGHRDRRARGEPQAVVVIGVMAAATLVGSVGELQSSVRAPELLGALWQGKLLCAVTARAGHIERLAVGATEARSQPAERVRLVDGHGEHRVGRDARFGRVEPREVVPVSALQRADKRQSQSECVGLHLEGMLAI